MPTFLWKGKTVSGEIAGGELTYESQEEALAYLRKRRVLITSLIEKPKELRLKLPTNTGVSVKELAIFTRQFATMIGAGLPLVQCLEILSKQTESAHFRLVITEV